MTRRPSTWATTEVTIWSQAANSTRLSGCSGMNRTRTDESQAITARSRRAAPDRRRDSAGPLSRFLSPEAAIKAEERLE